VKRFRGESLQRADMVMAAPNDQEELAKAGVSPGKFHTTYHLGDDSGLEAPVLQF
jgi:hypothetical protein